jgi:formylmethanofuran dehydrogenase subunit E
MSGKPDDISQEAWDASNPLVPGNVTPYLPAHRSFYRAQVARAIMAAKAEEREDKTPCAVCGENKHTPLRRDDMGGYVCLTCVDQYITDLTADRDKFRAIAQDTLSDTRLVNAGGRGEGFGFDLKGGPIPYITEYLFQFIGARDEAGPSNYAEIEVQHKEFGAMTLTLQRRSGSTPHQLRQEAETRLQAAEALVERLKLEAQAHASEARTANSTIYEIYQVISGGKGEPENWNGAEPVRAYVQAAEAKNRAYAEALEKIAQDTSNTTFGPWPTRGADIARATLQQGAKP